MELARAIFRVSVGVSYARAAAQAVALGDLGA